MHAPSTKQFRAAARLPDKLEARVEQTQTEVQLGV